MATDDQKHDVPIEVESPLDWAEGRENPVNEPPSICKVLSILRDLSPDSFKPQLVSIGPLHKEDPNVQDIERLKRFYLHDLLKRSTSRPNQPETIFEECLQNVIAKIVQIRSFYSATIDSDDQLANMMVMDGCFILEFCLKDDDEKPNTFLNDIQIGRIVIDLMLLENQIPLFVLQYIFDLTKPNSKSLTSLLRKVLLKHIHPFKMTREFSSHVPQISNGDKHVLEWLHKIYQFKSSSILSKKSENVEEETALNYNHSVVELERSGVNFKPQEEKNKPMAMKFITGSSCVLWPWSKPATLEMPTLIVQDYTEVILRNFIAYEQCFPEVNHLFTSYSCAMDKLINNEADVGKLVESRVLINQLGSHKEAATVINSVCKKIVVPKFNYSNEIQELDEYYNSFWPNSFAHLRRTYFNSPWSLIALLAGITLFGLTVVQTIFTVMSYYL